jgi:polyhydroxyalkanoate synthesis regulator phasin
MNPDEILQGLQKGFRVTLGAASTLVETIQDTQRREETLARLRTDPNGLAEDLAAKGEVTEQEARTFLENLMAQRPAGSAWGGSTGSSSGSNSSASSVPVAPPDIESDLKDLTEQISVMRAELERMRQEGN